MTRSKRCTRCKLEKTLDQFYRSANTYYSACKPCHRRISRESFRKRYQDPERRVVIAARTKAWRLAHWDTWHPKHIAYGRRVRAAEREGRELDALEEAS